MASPCQYMKCLQGIHRCIEEARQISGKCALFSATNFTHMHFDEGILLCMHIWWFCMWIQTVTTSSLFLKQALNESTVGVNVSVYARGSYLHRKLAFGALLPFGWCCLSFSIWRWNCCQLWPPFSLSRLTCEWAHMFWSSVSGNLCDISGVTKSIVLIRKIMGFELGV